MRKVLSLTLCMLALAFSAFAQQTSHWSYQYGQGKSEVYIYADIEMYQETINGFEQLEFTANDYQSYQFAAFLSGDMIELRGLAEAMLVPNAPKETYVLRFLVEGNDNDNGSEILFKAFDPVKQKEYDLVLASEPEFFSGDATIGEPSNPIHLQLTLPKETTPVTSITTPFYGFNEGKFSFIECRVGDDLTPYFVDGRAFDVLPAEASNKAVNLELLDGNESLTIDKAGNITATTTGAGMVKVTSVDNPQISCVVYVTAYNDYKTISVSQSGLSVTYKDAPVDVSGQVMNLVVLGPEGAQTAGDDMTYVSSDTEVLEISNDGIMAKKPGEADVTFTLPVVNRLMKTFDPNGNHTTYATANLHVTVVQGVTGIQIEWPTTLATGQSSQLIVRPVPQGARFGANAAISLSGHYMNYKEIVENTSIYYDENTNTYVGTVACNIPGELDLTVNYDDGEGTILSESSEVMECGYTFVMNQGWEWRTIPYANFNTLNSLETVFGTELVEIRTQGSQLYNDPVYGYFGNTGLLDQNVGFKLKMEASEAPKSYVFYGGSLGMDDLTLRKGWNYLPNPNVTVQTLDNAFSLNGAFIDGDRIVSKENGFAEYANGQWTGTLTTLQPGQGYLFYNAGEANRVVTYDNVYAPSSARRMLPRQAAKAKLWDYDASRFRDNMTIVAELNGQRMADNGQWSVGAFVGNECRGEGQAVDGRLFITVHADAGEQVSFKLRNEITGETFDIEQTVHMQQMLGSVKRPFGMTTDADTVTGIQNVNREPENSRCYDLGGRRISSNSKGIQLQRADDGSVRKLMR